MKLYELTQNYQQVLELIEEGEDYQDTLESIEGAIEDKAESIAKVIKTIEAQAGAVKTEKDRLAARQSALENEAKRLKVYTQDMLEAVGLDKIKGNVFTIGIQKNPASVEVYDADLIPSDYFIPQEPRLDKKALKDRLKAGEVPGAQLKQTRSLRIR